MAMSFDFGSNNINQFKAQAAYKDGGGMGGGGMSLMSLIPGPETRISHVAQRGPKKKKVDSKMKDIYIHIFFKVH